MKAEAKEEIRRRLSHLWNYVTEDGENAEDITRAFKDILAKNQVEEFFKESIVDIAGKFGVGEGDVIEAYKEIIPHVINMKMALVE